jgi:hypothetical protein
MDSLCGRERGSNVDAQRAGRIISAATQTANADYSPLFFMQHTFKDKKIFLALSANAIVLLLILLVMVSRDNRIGISSEAFGQLAQQPPITGGNGLFVMPAQLSPNTWGCYLLDSEHRTLCVYQFSPAEKLLRFAAGRNVENDRYLGDFNTIPSPEEIKDLVKRESEGVRATPPAVKSPETPAQ